MLKFSDKMHFKCHARLIWNNVSMNEYLPIFLPQNLNYKFDESKSCVWFWELLPLPSAGWQPMDSRTEGLLPRMANQPKR